MSKITVKVEGMDKLLKSLQKQKDNIKQQMSFEMETSVDNMVEGAAEDAPRGSDSFLAATISKNKEDDLNFEVVCPVSYAPYVEFGTKHYFKAIPGIDSSQFKGKGEGTAEEFLDSIRNWVKKKGIHFQSASTYKSGNKKGQNRDLDYETTAQFIYHHILLHGTKPHPFFFQQLTKEKPLLIKRLKKLLKAK